MIPWAPTAQPTSMCGTLIQAQSDRCMGNVAAISTGVQEGSDNTWASAMRQKTLSTRDKRHADKKQRQISGGHQTRVTSPFACVGHNVAQSVCMEEVSTDVHDIMWASAMPKKRQLAMHPQIVMQAKTLLKRARRHALTINVG